MKHLRVFENINQELWLVIFVSTEDHDTSVHVHADKESAENFLLDVINDDKKLHMEEDGYNENEDYETDIDEALEWYNDNIEHTKLYLESTRIKDSYKESEKLKQMRSSKKYNL